MKIQWFCILISAGIAGFFSTAQAQQLISTAGSSFVSKDISLSWSIGEPITETMSVKDWYFTQGFQQSNITTSSVEMLFIEKVTKQPGSLFSK